MVDPSKLSQKHHQEITEFRQIYAGARPGRRGMVYAYAPTFAYLVDISCVVVKLIDNTQYVVAVCSGNCEIYYLSVSRMKQCKFVGKYFPPNSIP